MATIRFKCPDCGMGDQEIGPLPETETHCIVCLEQDGRYVRLRYWVEETDLARVGEIAVSIDGGMATEALIRHVVVSKFCDGLLVPTPAPVTGQSR